MSLVENYLHRSFQNIQREMASLIEGATDENLPAVAQAFAEASGQLKLSSQLLTIEGKNRTQLEETVVDSMR